VPGQPKPDGYWLVPAKGEAPSKGDVRVYTILAERLIALAARPG
jgi:hypothetical protein